MAEEMRFDRRMSDADALMWAIEKDPLLRSTITAIAVLDRPPDRDRFTERMERASRLIPRLRQRAVGSPLVPAPPRWVVDPNFDLRYHLRWVQAPAPGTVRTLLDLAEPIASGVYFAPEAVKGYEALGLDYISGYFCSRGACRARGVTRGSRGAAITSAPTAGGTS